MKGHMDAAVIIPRMIAILGALDCKSEESAAVSAALRAIAAASNADADVMERDPDGADGAAAGDRVAARLNRLTYAFGYIHGFVMAQFVLCSSDLVGQYGYTRELFDVLANGRR